MADSLTKVGRYQIVGELGRGSMGVVFQGYDPVIGRTIAVKTMLTEGLSPAEFNEYKARFQREAQAAGILAHPNIVTVYDFGEEGGMLYLAMECLEGDSLEKVVEKQNILPIETIIPIYDQVCSALDHAHTHNIVHRDIKPANIMILTNGLVKVTDFGIAKMMSSGMTQAGQILGTPNYMSPEQVKGRSVDGRSDIFSLGVILYELVTGEKPFGGQNITTVIYKIINENPIAPRELDASIHPGLSYITSKALAKSPEERYQTCRELAEELRNYKNLGGSVPGGTVVLRAPQVATAQREGYAEPPRRVQPPGPPPTVEPAPGRPPSAQVIPHAKPKARGSSVVAWALVIFLLLAGLGGGGYYYYFLRPAQKAAVIPTPETPNPTPAAAVNPAPPKVGGLEVAANVSGAQITIDGHSDASWVTPHTIPDLAVGPHEMVLSKDGYKDQKLPVTVEEGRSVSVTGDLTKVQAAVEPKVVASRPVPVPKVGQLVLTANVDGARISIDNRSEPDWVTPHGAFSDLSAGSHMVSVSKDGYETANRSVTIEGGHTATLILELSTLGGIINIVTLPPGADVTIDGRPMGKSPVKATVVPGNHRYTATLSGMTPGEGTFTMENGKVLTKRVTWAEGPSLPMGVVEVHTIPPGATIFADGTGLSAKTPTSFRLMGGHHTLIISLPGYASFRKEINVNADDPKPLVLNVALSPQ